MTTERLAQWYHQRKAMVALLEDRGIDDPAVLQAMRSVPREEFVPDWVVGEAYSDSALPLTHSQTISQPLVVALMAQALQLQPTDRVLEIGTGSGYAAAVLGRLATEVYTVERVGDLAIEAAERIRQQGISNVHVRFGDGTKGWPENAPYDAISVAAGGEETPPALYEQLALGGRLVIPVGSAAEGQRLMLVTKVGPDKYEHENLGGVRFVPLLPDTE